jgi:hypothetical protein
MLHISPNPRSKEEDKGEGEEVNYHVLLFVTSNAKMFSGFSIAE